MSKGNYDCQFKGISKNVFCEGISNNIPLHFTLSGIMELEIGTMSNIELMFYSFFPGLFVKRCQKKLKRLESSPIHKVL